MSFEQVLSILQQHERSSNGSGFLHGRETPMTLCEICKRINFTLLRRLYGGNTFQGTPEHQPSYTALVAAAINGCDLCALILPAALKECSVWRKHCSLEESHRVFEERSTKENPQCKLAAYWPLVEEKGNVGSYYDFASNLVDYISFSIPYDRTSVSVNFTPRLLPGDTHCSYFTFGRRG